ncbi:NAD-dependent epimerase/dehydratase family protein [Salininema proteolyticum]|uniref:NAD-dependent epimerase/dehydratase family protein n=1 Tax=Salininema proteolyticum TaxID=1607685 RepID=A0ABV8U3Y7_9ACTN
MSSKPVLVTGGAGLIGTALRRKLNRPLRLLDIAAAEPPAPGEDVEIVSGSATDPEAMEAAAEGVSAIVHLAGIPGEAPWNDISEANLHSTQVALEAARSQGIDRFVYASSNHASGFQERDDLPEGGLPDDVDFAPDTYYGVTKVASEALCRLYADRFGMDALCLRIGTCRETPHDARSLSTWLSLDDCARLVEAALDAPSPGFRQVWGVSANTRRWWSTAGGDAIGYRPEDDAEAFAERILAAEGPIDPADPAHRYVGGRFTIAPLGE